MSVSMAKTPSEAKLAGPKAPFKKVFSSNQLITTQVDVGIRPSPRHGGDTSGGNGSTFCPLPLTAQRLQQITNNNNLSSQFSSSLPGILDNISNSGNKDNKENIIKPSSANETAVACKVSSPRKSSVAVISTSPSSPPKQSSPPIPLSAIEPSLIVSLSTYLSNIKEFDSSKLVKEIERLLIYFQDVFRKHKLEQLSGASTILLETVGTNCTKLKRAYQQLLQVQLRLQLLSNLNNDEENSSEPNHQVSSPIIKATIELYQSLSQLLKWTDEVFTLEYFHAKATTTSTSSAAAAEDKETTEANVGACEAVCKALLGAFEKLVEAYKALEADLTKCYHDYLIANKQIVDLILAESQGTGEATAAGAAATAAGGASALTGTGGGSASNQKIPTIRRRSVTPPPDMHAKIVPSRNQNGSTSTIASLVSSASSSNSTHFLSKSRFFPNIITNQAQKMAHHFEKKLSKSSAQTKEPPGKSSIVNNSEKHIWSFISSSFGSSSNNNNNSLKRSESADDVTNIPVENLSNDEKDLLQIQSELAFQRRSHRKLSDVSILPSALEAKAQDNNSLQQQPKTSPKTSTVNRHDLTLQIFDGSRRASNPHPTQIILLESSPTHRSAQRHRESAGQLMLSSNIPSSTTTTTTTVIDDRPPPLPPKRNTNSGSVSSTRSSLASNCSNSTNSSKDLKTVSATNDNDSGLGSCDLANRPPPPPPSTVIEVPGHKPLTRTNVVDAGTAQMVTLRRKKEDNNFNDNVCHKCHGVKPQAPKRPSSPPPLPSPDSVLLNILSPSDILPPVSNEITASHEKCACLNCPEHSYLIGHQAPPPPPPPVQPSPCSRNSRSYRRHTTRPGAMAKSQRSYSIADNSILKPSNYLTPYNDHQPLAHSSSFPHRLSHSASSCDGSLVPPPLPPKRRNMHEYMVMVTNYMGPTDVTELFRYSRADTSKSMIDPSLTVSSNPPNSSASASVLSLSSSDSSTLSSGHNSVTNLVASNAIEIDREQYARLPRAPSPPVKDIEGESLPPPPVLPPRRDRGQDSRPAPPPVPSIEVQKQVLQKRQSDEQHHGIEITTTTCETRCRCSAVTIAGANFERASYLEKDNETKPEEIVEEVEVVDEHEEEVEEVRVEIEVEGDDEEEGEEEEEEENMCCTICSEGTVHSEDECCLAKVDVRPRMLSFKLPGEEDEFLGDIDIRGGTVDALVIKATQAASGAPDNTFLEVFLATYRAFITPHYLLSKLIFRYNKFSACGEKTDNIRQSIARKVVAFIILVVNEIYLYDFDKFMSDTLMEFIYQLVGRGDLVHAKCLREKCYEKIRQRDRELMALATPQPITHNISTKTATILSFKSEHLAEQMTLLDSQLFHKIEIPELLIWAQEQKEELIPNLNKFTEHFNKVSFWTRSRILQCEEQKEREKYVTKFLKIMKHLRKLNNFNSYLAILSALCSAPISRLDWSKTITETIKELQVLIDSSSSFRIYRTALATAKPPCIPYIGLILQDLTFVHIGNSDFLPDGTINIGKRYKQYNIMSQMKQFKQYKYAVVESEPIIMFFDNFDDSISEEAMWQISESIKPRGGGGNNSNSSN